jgi:uncharacterized protein YkwD
VRRAKTIFLALTASAVLACASTVAEAASDATAHVLATAPLAKAAAAHATRHPRRPHAGCSVSRRHSRRRHRRRCRTRRHAQRTKLAHGNDGAPPTPTQGRAGSRPAHARSKRARHTGGQAKTVSVSAASAPAAAAIASVLATPCLETEAIPTAANVEAAQAATLCLVNQERARHGELPLSVNAQLAKAARLHSQDMLEGDYFAHVAPDGETPLQRVTDSGYIPNSQVGYTIGENIAWGTLYLATPSSIVNAWIASPEHLANILNGAYRDTAIAVAPAAPPSLADGQAGAIYTQEFGVLES